MKVTWDDLEESSSDEEQFQNKTTNTCFVAHSDSEVSDN